jgi:hypothetical protein
MFVRLGEEQHSANAIEIVAAPQLQPEKFGALSSQTAPG